MSIVMAVLAVPTCLTLDDIYSMPILVGCLYGCLWGLSGFVILLDVSEK